MFRFCVGWVTLGVAGWLTPCGEVFAQQPPTKPSPPPTKSSAAAPPAKSGNTSDKQASIPNKVEGTPNKNTQPPAKAADTSVKKEALVTRTYDGVELRGDFYPASDGKGKKAPVLVLLHAVGPKHLTASRKDFDKLPERLQKQGYTVVTFDFRGYGESKTVNVQEFIKYNRMRNSKNPEHIEGKDYASTPDLLNMMNDLVAVKNWLNKKNNIGDCNSSVLGIIAVEQAGVIASGWIANELTDPNRTKEKRSNIFIPGVGNVQGTTNTSINPNTTGFGTGSTTSTGITSVARQEGEDVVCLIAVSSSQRLNENMNLQVLERWFAVLRDRRVSTVAIYGSNDRDANTFWTKAGNWIKPPREKERYRNSGVLSVKNTNLTGTKLLLNETLEVAKSLEEFLNESVKKTADGRLWTEQIAQDQLQPVDLSRLIR